MATQSEQLFDGKYKKIRQLGHGMYGDVYLAQDTVLARNWVAVKILRDPDLDHQVMLLREMGYLCSLHHPHIVRFLHHFQADSSLGLVMAFHHSSSFSEGALLAVNLGDDADTTGAVYGQLAGAYYGATGIPPEWLDTLHARALITQFADRLLGAIF